jgi:hypothetical protein
MINFTEYDENNKTKISLSIDNIGITEDLGYAFIISNKVSIGIYDIELAERAANITFNEIPAKIYSIDLYSLTDILDLVDKVAFERIAGNTDYYELNFEFSFDWDNWKNKWSISEYVQSIEQVVKQLNNENICWVQSEPESIMNGCHIGFKVFNSNSTLLNEINDRIPIVQDLHERAIISIISALEEDSFVSSFNFPDSVRIPCEQYLLYFIQFLRDIGIEATANITHEAGNVLFSVTPTSNSDALKMIRQALYIYLQLPTNPAFSNYLTIPTEPQVQQLIANIQHLKGQLMLANAVIEAKNATIQLQQQSIQQQSFVTTAILQESVRYLSKGADGKDKEDILGGAISLTKLEGKGFEVNIPYIFRWIKKILGKGNGDN